MEPRAATLFLGIAHQRGSAVRPGPLHACEVVGPRLRLPVRTANAGLRLRRAGALRGGRLGRRSSRRTQSRGFPKLGRRSSPGRLYYDGLWTSLGRTEPASQDGLLAGATLAGFDEPVHVSVAGQDEAVIYAGSAPDMIDRVVQINRRVPGNLPRGLRLWPSASAIHGRPRRDDRDSINSPVSASEHPDSRSEISFLRWPLLETDRRLLW
jgi:hypothetical protein